MDSENFSRIFNDMDWSMNPQMKYKHSSPTSSAERYLEVPSRKSGLGTNEGVSAGNGQHVFTPCSLDENIVAGLEYHDFGSPGHGWMAGSPSNVQATLPCPNCHTHIKLSMGPDTTPLAGGGDTFKQTALDSQQSQQWSNSPNNPTASLAPGTTMHVGMPQALIHSAAVTGGQYEQRGAFQHQHQPPVNHTGFSLQSPAQLVPSVNMRGATTGTRPMVTYNGSSRRTSTANLNSPGSYCDSPSDHSSPNEGNSNNNNNNNKRKRLEDKEKPARYVAFLNILAAAPSSYIFPRNFNSLTSAIVWGSFRGRKPSYSAHIKYLCTVDGCNKTFGSKKECERHQTESRAHPEMCTEKYVCEEERCPQYGDVFTRKDNLGRHNKAKHGDYS